MTNLKDLYLSGAYNFSLNDFTVSVILPSDHHLYLIIDKNEIVTTASYAGQVDLWLTGLCHLIKGKNLAELKLIGPSSWLERYSLDPFFCDHWDELKNNIVFWPEEALRAAIGKYLGQEHLYRSEGVLVCRCFGVRESAIINYLNEAENPTLSELTLKTKAGMGCRSCRPQLEKLFLRQDIRKLRYYKDKPLAEWLLLVDEKLKASQLQAEWGFEILSFKQGRVVITYTKKASQREEEEITRELQHYLAGVVDPDLAFFLRRS
jgi:bacterioferritin-associated ferredoxin